MNCFEKIMLLLFCMVMVDFSAYAQTDACYKEGSAVVSCGESSAGGFMFCYRNGSAEGEYSADAASLSKIHRSAGVASVHQIPPPLNFHTSVAKDLRESAPAKRTILALKTNMLYDAVTVLNFSVEGVINRNFSILYEQHCPWWLTGNNRYCFQLLTFGGEFRWWFRPTTERWASRTDYVKRDALVGHFLGLYGFGGTFDVQAKRKGCYQGEILSVGLTYGYSMPICKRLNLEFSISVGYANIPYRHYIPTADYDMLIRDPKRQGRTHYVGPTKVGVALVVPILATFKSKGGGR